MSAACYWPDISLPPSPPPKALDVNHDSQFTPLDALIAINAVHHAHSDGVQPPSKLDVTGDDQVNMSDIDAIFAGLTRAERFSELAAPPPLERSHTAGLKDRPVDAAELDELFADAESSRHGHGSHPASASQSSSGGRPFVSIEATDTLAFEQGTDPGEFRVYRNGGSGGTNDLEVHLSVGGTASEGDDYQALSKSVTIPAGDPAVTFLVTPIDDTVESEGPETVVVKIAPDQNGQDYNRNILCDVVTIEDNDSGGSGGSGGSSNQLDLSVAEVHARRMSPTSIDEGFYRIKSDEHFDIGSTFEFELVCAQGDTSDIRWEVWEDDPLGDDLLASGDGTSFTHAFSSGDDGADPYVRFYNDADGNGSENSGEAYLNSKAFYVQERKTYDIDVDVSSEISSPPNFSTIQSLLDGAANVLLRKDSHYDARSAVDFALSSVSTFTATAHGGARPDPLADQPEEREKHYDAPADIVLIDKFLDETHLGFTGNNDWHRIIVEYTGNSASLLHVVIAHEMGHGVGLHHGDHVDPQIMNPTVSPDNIEQTLADADAYD